MSRDAPPLHELSTKSRGRRRPSRAIGTRIAKILTYAARSPPSADRRPPIECHPDSGETRSGIPRGRCDSRVRAAVPSERGTPPAPSDHPVAGTNERGNPGLTAARRRGDRLGRRRRVPLLGPRSQEGRGRPGSEKDMQSRSRHPQFDVESRAAKSGCLESRKAISGCLLYTPGVRRVRWGEAVRACVEEIQTPTVCCQSRAAKSGCLESRKAIIGCLESLFAVNPGLRKVGVWNREKWVSGIGHCRHVDPFSRGLIIVGEAMIVRGSRIIYDNTVVYGDPIVPCVVSIR